MCVIGWAFNQSKRFPVIMVNNRDELVNRETSDMGEHKERGPNKRTVFCALDESIPNGGTWLALNITEGGQFEFAVLTNSRRCPSTVMGMDAFEPPESPKAKTHPALPVWLPAMSRGRLVLDFVEHGKLPEGSTSGETKMDGYNFFSGSLADIAKNGGPMQYTTNRYAPQEGTPLPTRGEDARSFVTCANMTLDHPTEFRSNLLRDYLAEAVGELEKQQSAAADGQTLSVEEVADLVASRTICQRPNLTDVPQDLIESSKPFVGLSGAEKAALGITEEGIASIWSEYAEREHHRNIYCEVLPNYPVKWKTRTQTVILVENTTPDAPAGKESFTVHILTRESIQADQHHDWKHFSYPMR